MRSARTAPTRASNADELRAEHAGHEAIEVLSGEYRELLARFLAGETVASQSITLPPARFRAP
jgi:hypothetical protein